jgi:hypothetical protein
LEPRPSPSNSTKKPTSKESKEAQDESDVFTEEEVTKRKAKIAKKSKKQKNKRKKPNDDDEAEEPKKKRAPPRQLPLDSSNEYPENRFMIWNFKIMFLLPFRFDWFLHTWYIDVDENLVVNTTPRKILKIVAISKKKQKVHGINCLTWDFDYKSVVLAHDKMDFCTSDAASFLHENWDQDHYLTEEKRGKLCHIYRMF